MNNDDHDNFDFNYDELSDEDRAGIEEQMKEEDRKLRSHPLYKQAKEIMKIVDLLLESVKDRDEREMYGATLRESTMIILSKLSSGLTGEGYSFCMQKAAIIRDHAEYLRLSNHMLNSRNSFDPRYVKLFREEMEKFRELFRNWAAEIQKMDNEVDDEWGLFIKE